MRIVFIGLIFLLVMGFSPSPDKGVLIHRFIVQPASTLTIDGKTNVNTFQCAIPKYFGSDTLILKEARNRRPVFIKGYVGLRAETFDCGMQVMTNDFGKTIRAKEHPLIYIEFISFEKVPRYSGAEEKFKGKVKISLGGVTRPFEMDCSIEAKKSGFIHLKGGRNFAFSDFNMEPPTKMFGMVKVNDELEVNFHLVLLLDKNA